MGSKRVPPTGPQTPSHLAAHHLLRSRLRSVSRLIADISAGRVRRPEFIHQLRVSIRRADAALNAFEPCLGADELADTRKRLRDFRKAAGATRDCDSQACILPTLLSSDTPDQHNLAKYLSRRLAATRNAAAESTLDAARTKRADKYKRSRKNLVATIASPESADESNSATLLRSAADALGSTLSATRAAANEDLQDLNRLHGLRVAAKQVRYAVELFRVCLPGQLCDSALAGLREFQSLLGRVNDARQMAKWLTDEALLLTDSDRPKGIPRGATPESVHEELRVLLGRFEAEREVAHAAALPEIPVKLDAALHPLEDWIRTTRATLSPSPAPERESAGRDAQGRPERKASTAETRRAATI
jgi:CHAD domain-containing protein